MNKQSAISNQPSAFRNEFLSLRNLIHKARLNSSLMELANEATVELDIVEQAAVTLAESLEELARLRAALQEIAVGKTQEDNTHPLGEYASMAGRFLSIAQDALKGES